MKNRKKLRLLYFSLRQDPDIGHPQQPPPQVAFFFLSFIVATAAKITAAATTAKIIIVERLFKSQSNILKTSCLPHLGSKNYFTLTFPVSFADSLYGFTSI